MKSFRDVIELWPRRTDFAADVGIAAVTASTWWQRNSIPAPFFNPVVESAQRRGHYQITHKLLADLAERRARERRTATEAA